jgi:hypothetical protein
MKEEIATIAQRSMDRKEFLRYVGFLIITIVGVAAVLKSTSSTLDNLVRPSHESTTSDGYGR